MVFSLSALWWRRIRGLWKLLDGRDCLRGNLGLVLKGLAMLSKSLIHFSVERWGCVPSMPLTFWRRCHYLYYLYHILASGQMTGREYRTALQHFLQVELKSQDLRRLGNKPMKRTENVLASINLPSGGCGGFLISIITNKTTVMASTIIISRRLTCLSKWQLLSWWN